MNKFTEAQLEQAFIDLLHGEEIPHVLGETIQRAPNEVSIKEDLKAFLSKKYQSDQIMSSEIDAIILQLETYPASDLYESNKAIMKLVSDGFILKREDRAKKDVYIQLIDYSGLEQHRMPDHDDLLVIAAEDQIDYPIDQNI